MYCLPAIFVLFTSQDLPVEPAVQHGLYLRIQPEDDLVQGTLFMDFELGVDEPLEHAVHFGTWFEPSELQEPVTTSHETSSSRPSPRLLSLIIDGEPISLDHDHGRLGSNVDLAPGPHRLIAVWHDSLSGSFQNFATASQPLYLPRGELFGGHPICPQGRPGEKAIWTVNVELPTGWSAISNARSHQISAGSASTMHSFTPSPPLASSDLFLAFGPLESTTIENDDSVTLWMPKGDRFQRARELVDLHRRALRTSVEWTNYPLPLQKLDLLIVPGLHRFSRSWSGVIVYREWWIEHEEPIGLDPSFQVAREVSAQWLGLLVTPSSAGDVWCFRGLCDLLALKILEQEPRGWDPWLAYVEAFGFEALRIDASGLELPSELGLASSPPPSLDDPFARAKATLIMSHREKELGSEVFWNRVKTFIRDHAFDHASWEAFIEGPRNENETSEIAVDSIRKWIGSSPPPRLLIHSEMDDEDSIVECRFEQRAEKHGSIRPLCFEALVIDGANQVERGFARSAFSQERLSFALGMQSPKTIMLNADLRSCFFPTAVYDMSIDDVIPALAELASIERFAWGAGLWEALHTGRMPRDRVVAMLEAALEAEFEDPHLLRAYAHWYQRLLQELAEPERRERGTKMAAMGLARLDRPGLAIAVARRWLYFVLELPLDTDSQQKLRRLVAGTWQPRSLVPKTYDLRRTLIRLVSSGLEEPSAIPLDVPREERPSWRLLLEAARDRPTAKREAWSSLWDRPRNPDGGYTDSWFIDFARALGSGDSGGTVLLQALRKASELGEEYPPELVYLWIRTLLGEGRRPETLATLEAFLEEEGDNREPWRRWLELFCRVETL